MSPRDKNRLRTFLIEAFLHRYLVSNKIPLDGGTYTIDHDREEELRSYFYSWWEELGESVDATTPTGLVAAIQAIGCNAWGASEFLSHELITRNRAMKTMAHDPLVLPEQPNPMLGPELTGGVTKEDVRALLAKLAAPWHL